MCEEETLVVFLSVATEVVMCIEFRHEAQLTL